MLARLSLLFFLLVAGCVSQPEQNTTISNPDATSPLVGAWVAEAFGGEIHERWEMDSDGVLLKQEGYFVADGDTSYSETVAIGAVGETTYLIAHPSTGGVLVWEQTDVSETGMTFENPNNENPSRIVYSFSGSGAFTRVLHGMEDGEEVVNELNFTAR